MVVFYLWKRHISEKRYIYAIRILKCQITMFDSYLAKPCLLSINLEKSTKKGICIIHCINVPLLLRFSVPRCKIGIQKKMCFSASPIK